LYCFDYFFLTPWKSNISTNSQSKFIRQKFTREKKRLKKIQLNFKKYNQGQKMFKRFFEKLGLKVAEGAIKGAKKGKIPPNLKQDERKSEERRKTAASRQQQQEWT
jgi:hypothetical protein